LPSTPEQAAASRPHISEWFGHRVFPAVAAGPAALADQTQERCPFLSHTLRRHTHCIKNVNSRGVCTISATSNGARQDWLVCPYRALDDALLADMSRRLYDLPAATPVLIIPAITLQEPVARDEALAALQPDDPRHVFVYFQDKLGGEISLSRTPASPELSFDITIIELLPAGPGARALDRQLEPQVRVGRYGIIELQTTDTHGSYRQAVTALTNALDLHGDQFPKILAENPEWAGRKIEGPNISNVFKRTFYQIAFKFQITSRDTSAGCILALPQPVWDSWQPFLGAPELRQHPDGTWRLLDDKETSPRNWIYVFDIDQDRVPGARPAPIHTRLVIGTDARTLSRAAFDIAPAKALQAGAVTDAVLTTIARRLTTFAPGIDIVT
jgi:hypothetical protein